MLLFIVSKRLFCCCSESYFVSYLTDMIFRDVPIEISKVGCDHGCDNNNVIM
jgi:hypothetical protein